MHNNRESMDIEVLEPLRVGFQLFAIKSPKSSPQEIQNALERSSELRQILYKDRPYSNYLKLNKPETPTDAFDNSNLANAIMCTTLLAVSIIYPYHSEDFRNRSLFFPLMLVLRLVFCVRDFVLNFFKSLYYLATRQWKSAFLSFIQLLCNIATPIIHIVNVVLACVSILLRNILSLLFGYQEEPLPNESPNRAILSGIHWDQTEDIDTSLNTLIFNTKNTFFRHDFAFYKALSYPNREVLTVNVKVNKFAQAREVHSAEAVQAIGINLYDSITVPASPVRTSWSWW
ncbi:MAG: hypothetical protein Q8R83_05670 [Legionellaceae bacterium]|nr:hypothetical protein [Legionellaceae bacterium]